MTGQDEEDVDAMLPYLKLFTEARNDAKLRSLTDAQHRVWFNLLCFVSEQPERGIVRGLSHHHVAVEVSGGDQDLLVETCNALSALQSVTWCYMENGAVEIVFLAFEKRQAKKPSADKSSVRDRVAKHRERKRSGNPSAGNAAVTPDVTPGNAHVTPCNKMRVTSGAKTGPKQGQNGVDVTPPGVAATSSTPMGSDDKKICNAPVTRCNALEVDVEEEEELNSPPKKEPPLTPLSRSGEDLDLLNQAERLLRGDLRTEGLGLQLGRQHNTAANLTVAGWKWLRAAETIQGPSYTDTQRRSFAYFAKIAANLADSDREPKPPAKRESKMERQAREFHEGAMRMKAKYLAMEEAKRVDG